ncbi:tape measure protein [Limosilactobacillus reuteri]|uniref:Lytic transglycosylase n=1 Tax=Limosilactobacillus reuteri TaxID=1598 RepID=A0A256SUH6_LIMRT|nr:tape measure protein [Limosilactobacillus reuteri]OYS70491.1 lytic transglycosylase [Limosilactobacillus reuteri]
MSSPVVEKEFLWKFRDEITQGVAKARQAMQEAVSTAKEAGMKVSDTGEDWKKMGTDAKETAQDTSQSLDTMKEKLLSYQHAATDASKNIREQVGIVKEDLNGIPKQKIINLKAKATDDAIKAHEKMIHDIPPEKWTKLYIKDAFSNRLQDFKNKIHNATESAQHDVEQTKHSFSDLKGTMAGTFLGGAALGGIYAIGNGLKEAAAAGMEFNTEQQKMQQTWLTLTDSKQAAQGMVDTINELSVKTGQSRDLVNELEQGFYHLHSSKEESDAMTKSMLNMGDAVGLTSDQMKQVEQDMVHGLATGKVTQGELNQIGMYFPMIDEAMAKHFNTTVKGMREMAHAGKISGEDLEKVFEELGSGKYEKAADNMMQSMWGMERTIKSQAPALIGAFERPLFNAKNPFYEAVSKWALDPATQKGFENAGKVLSDIFNGAITGVADVIKPFQGLNKVVGAFIGQFASGAWKGIKESFEVMGAALNAVGKVIEFILTPVNELSRHLDGLGKARKPIEGLGAAFGTVMGPLIALRGAVAAYNTVLTVHAVASTIATKASELFGAVNKASMATMIAANPIIAGIAVAIIAIAAAFKLAYDHSTRFRNAVNRMAQIVKDLFHGKIGWREAFKREFDEIKSDFSKFLKVLGGNSKLAPYINKLTVDLKKLWAQVKPLLKEVLSDVTKLWKALEPGFKNVLNHIVLIGKALKPLASGTLKIMVKTWQTQWKLLGTIVKAALKVVVEVVKLLMKNLVASIKLFLDAIHGNWKGVWGDLKNICRNDWNFIKSVALIGISALKSVISIGLNWITNIWHTAWNSFTGFFRGIWNVIKQAASDGMNGVINVINSGIGAINKVWSFFTGHGTGLNKLGHVHFAQGGTVHRHLSVINDGDGPDWKELVQTPDGNLFMSQERNWTGFLPEGTRVYSGAETRQIMNAVGVSHHATGGIVGAQHFADGGIIGEGIDWAKGSLENIGSWLGDKFSALEDFLADPLKATKGLLEKATGGLYKGLGNFADVAHGAMDKLTQPIADWFKKGLEKLEAQFESGGASPDLIRAAAAKMHVAISGGDISHIMNVIKHESGGNARAINNWDSNAKRGDPSKGILQFIQSTFNKYAVAGHTNIYSPFDQLLAMFNDTTWRSDLTLGGWGPTGGRRFATGGEVFGLTNAIIGDNPEHHEFVLNPYAVSAEPLLDRAFEATAQAQPANSSTGNGNSKLDQMIDLLGKVLVAIESQDTDIYLDGEKVTDDVSKRQGKTWRLRKN